MNFFIIISLYFQLASAMMASMVLDSRSAKQYEMDSELRKGPKKLYQQKFIGSPSTEFSQVNWEWIVENA